MHEKYVRDNAVLPMRGYDVSSLKGKSVIVTGAASGLGEEIARQFVQAGAFVTLADLSNERGTQIAAELGEDKTAFVQCDVTKWTDQVNVFKTAIARSPGHQIDIVVANAGIGARDTLWLDDAKDDEPIEPDLSMVNVNFIAVIYTIKLATHYLCRNTTGSDRCLILTASMAAYIDQPGTPQYNATKWGVRGLMRTLRCTSPGLGIRINTLAPWYVHTRIIPDQLADTLRGKGVPFAEKRSAGEAAVHIASDPNIHGRSLCIIPADYAPEGRKDLQPTGKGYIDLERDDFNEGETITELQDLVLDAWKEVVVQRIAPDF